MKVFVTGASMGIGRELTRILVSEGHEVKGLARNTKALENLAGELNSSLFTYHTCDLTDVAAMDALHGSMVSENYVPDIVVLNAALDIEEPHPVLCFQSSAQMMRCNLEGAHFWVCAFIEPFLNRGHGQFVAVSSIFAHWPDGNSVAYSASKSALSMLFRGLRIRYRKTGLSFKLLYLGPVDTSINSRFAEIDSTKSRVVASAPATAAYLYRLLNCRRATYYFPFYILVVFMFLRWLPDRAFELLTAKFKR